MYSSPSSGVCLIPYASNILLSAFTLSVRLSRPLGPGNPFRDLILNYFHLNYTLTSAYLSLYLAASSMSSSRLVSCSVIFPLYLFTPVIVLFLLPSSFLCNPSVKIVSLLLTGAPSTLHSLPRIICFNSSWMFLDPY